MEKKSLKKQARSKKQKYIKTLEENQQQFLQKTSNSKRSSQEY